MSVLLETSVGDIVIDLYTAESPLACSNFLKLCAIKYYNDCTFHTVKRDFLIQTGDPTNTGKGGQSIHSILAAHAAAAFASSAASAPPSRLLRDERHPALCHRDKYTVSLVRLDGFADSAASQFFITTAPQLQSLDGRHTVFGRVAEGQDVVDKINAAPVDESGRPAVHIRIRHTLVLDDPFPSPPELLALIPPASPASIHTPFDYEVIYAAVSDAGAESSTSSTQPVSAAAASASSSAAAVNPHAVVLEMIGDLPSADVAPPENVLFVCKLNPITTSEDLRLIFSRFGSIVDCNIVTDSRTGASLCYAFIEFAERSSCEAAYLKMDNIIIDDRRIRVDFSQSVSRQWRLSRQQASRRGTTAAPLAAAAGGRSGQAVEGRAERRQGSRWGDKRSDAGGAEQQQLSGRSRDSNEVESERKDAGRQHVEERKDSTRESERRERRHEKAKDENEDREQREDRDRDDDRHRRKREERHGHKEREEGRERHRKRSRERRRSESSEAERDARSRPVHHHSSRSSSSRHHRHRHRRDASASLSPSRSRSPRRT